MRKYKVLNKNNYESGEFKIIPLRLEDRFEIMKWRNEQIYHLRQNKPLTEKDQDEYYKSVVDKLYEKERPDQILFSFLKGEKLIGYGGLVHINWIDENAEISFIMETALETNNFESLWIEFLNLIEEVAFKDLSLHKIFTYAFDLRPKLYTALKKSGFGLSARLSEHCFFENKFIDVLIHSKFNKEKELRNAAFSDVDLIFNWAKNPIVRQYSFSKEKIQFGDHVKWFINKIEDPKCRYYILEINGVPAGSIRFDLDENNEALITYLIDPVFSGKGLGTYILKVGLERLESDVPFVKVISGYVMPENIASIKIFEKLRFKDMGRKEYEGIEMIEFIYLKK
ncbi:GNAT family N-acetyltransferase [Gramella sp. MAR_2010_147]|uniref:GNAT family N-acetyltransferase n=1 Tax=Gramella sp. MAR_2010_147 TaxID=1250205 RepID=UPI00087B30B4|nr:GNAT family N-acetyltransferase [Gramella sp. MAR_2010_147]SDR69640.1 Protein N-acetyltransferase, RimJ/RimL family [Gramella sp. MAR_2010_147]